MSTFDLKQVGKLFDDTVSAIREDTPDMATLEPQALEWLKAARYKLMRDIESAYYKLQRSRNTPLEQPAWAVDPSQKLFLETAQLPTVLLPFLCAIESNLLALLKDCGFHHCTSYTDRDGVAFWIRFPEQLAPAGAKKKPSQTLYVQDEFSQRREEGEGKRGNAPGPFSASEFGRLLIDARGENDTGNPGEDGRNGR
ncbi:hypothetical protein DFH06DRAFT_1472319 [Mycena polygramma]|nr:hypothetical protein DFH06DRAFT_1472319 [Mycena polygramma]